MGGLCSKSEDKYEAKPEPRKQGAGTGSQAASTGAASGTKSSTARSKSGVPDFGLGATHEVVKLLGRGGEGETWLIRDKSSGEEVAAKLIKRPIPKAALAVIKREIKIQADLGQGQVAASARCAWAHGQYPNVQPHSCAWLCRCVCAGT